MGNVAQARLVALEPQDDVVEATRGATVPLPALDVPRARRPGWPTLAALAIACGLAAVALGAGALVAETRSDPPAPPEPVADRTLALLTDSSAERYPLRGSVGRIVLVVGAGGRAALTLDGLGAAPSGSVYAAWIVPPGSAVPVPAGSFDATARVVPLERSVPRGARVAVTLEEGDAPERPSRPLRLVAVRG